MGSLAVCGISREFQTFRFAERHRGFNVSRDTVSEENLEGEILHQVGLSKKRVAGEEDVRRCSLLLFVY